MSEAQTPGERVLILMTNPKDGERTLAVLTSAGLHGVVCTDGPHLCRELASEVGVVLLSEEAIVSDTEGRLQKALRAQPAWSVVPLVAITREGSPVDRQESLLSDLSANVTLVERPVRMRTLLSVIRGALRARRHQYEARDAIIERELALDAARLGWWRYDPSTQIVTHDERFAEIYGLAGRSRSIEEISRLLHPDDSSRIWAAAEAAMNPLDPQPYAVEYRLIRSDGTLRWVEAHGLAAFDGDGTARRMTSFVGTVADVTDRKRAEEELLEADRRKDEFLATLAHELRNPLAPIRTGLGVLRLSGLNPDAENVLSVMDRQLAQLVGIVDDLLDVARVTSGKIVIRPQPLDLREAVEAAIETSRPSVEAAGHELDVRLTDDPLPVNGDLTRLSQVVTNVLTNACKYTPDRGRIELVTEREGEHAVVRVTDNGIGIPADMLPKVFDTFTQVGRALDRSQGGLGLGLALVRRLVEKHGGTVSAESPGPGKGSTFTILLPLTAARPLTTAASRRAVNQAAMADLPVRRVLIVDDLKPAADLLDLMLRRLGQETRVVYDGPAALKTIAEFQPDVVISDIGMHGMDGYELARRVRSMFDSLPVLVALTGYGQIEDQRRAFDAGFDHHLVKPSSVDALRQLLLTIPSRSAESGAAS